MNTQYITFPHTHSLQYELARARNISATLGTLCAAAYMRNRGWSLEAALWNLLRKEVVASYTN